MPGAAVCSQRPAQINVLPGCHLSAADIEELREIIQSFGLDADRAARRLRVPGRSHVRRVQSDDQRGGRRLPRRAAWAPRWTIAIGEQMRPAPSADRAQRRAPRRVRPSHRAGRQRSPAGLAFRAQRRAGAGQVAAPAQPVAGCHARRPLLLGGKKVAIGAEPDLLWSLANLLHEMGCEIVAAVTTTQSPLLGQVPAQRVVIGDLEDLEAARPVATCWSPTRMAGRPPSACTLRTTARACRCSTGWARRTS
jgi:nitrogenase molybdenum-iron protein NifN